MDDELNKYFYNDISNIIIDYVGPFLFDYFPDHIITSIYSYYGKVLAGKSSNNTDGMIYIIKYLGWSEYLKNSQCYNPIDFRFMTNNFSMCLSNNNYFSIICIYNIDKDHNAIYKYLKNKNLIQYKTNSIFKYMTMIVKRLLNLFY